jgi:hypothetical protein
MPQIHGCIMGMQCIQPLDEFTCDFGDNAQVISGRHPRVSSTNVSFKKGRISPNTICRMYSHVSCLSGSPAMMSGLVIITDALVPLVMRYDLSPIYPLAFKLLLPSLADMLSVQ